MRRVVWLLIIERDDSDPAPRSWSRRLVGWAVVGVAVIGIVAVAVWRGVS